MFIRVISGRLKPGTWSDYEKAYREAVSQAGAVEGLIGRWLTRDIDQADSGTTISLWATVEAMQAYERSDVLKNVIQPKLQPFFTGDYRTSRSEVRYAEGDPAPEDWVGSDS
jgi:heme-degrading monooxygenase HmoA